MKNKTVTVVGGGVAGAYTAYRLSQSGADVTVLTSDKGRLRGVDGLPSHGESNAGGMRIANSHNLVLGLVREIGIDSHLTPFVNYNGNGRLDLRGESTTFDRAEDLAPLYDAAHLGDPRKAVDAIMQDVLHELDAPQGDAAVEAALCDGHALGYTSFRDHCRALGLSDDEITYLAHVDSIYPYMDTPIGELAVDRQSLYGSRGYWRLSPNLGLLPKTLLQKSGARIINKATVTDIDTSGPGVLVSYHSPKGNRSMASDFVVVTCPAPAVNRIGFTSALPVKQTEAFREVGYADSSKTLIEVTHPFWLDASIDGGRDWTDRVHQQSVFPKGVSQQERCTFVASYTWQAGARRLMAMGCEERFELIAESIETLHPGARRLMRRYKHVDWNSELGGGAFAYFKAGDYHNYYRLMSEPHPADDPRVFFCGEHAGLHHGWAESALQSAQLAMMQLAASL